MRSSRPLIGVGVGVLVAIQAAPSVAQVPESSTVGSEMAVSETATAEATQPPLAQAAKSTQATDKPANPHSAALSSASDSDLPSSAPLPSSPGSTLRLPQDAGQRSMPAQLTLPKPPPIAQAQPLQTLPTLAPALKTAAPLQVPVINSPILPDPGPSRPIGPAKAGTPPEYLNPPSNPLYFPTKPSDVKLQGIQPITLQQAIELARRNNRDYQVAELQYKQAKAALREAQAENFPTLTIAGSLIDSSRTANGELSKDAVEQPIRSAAFRRGVASGELGNLIEAQQRIQQRDRTLQNNDPDRPRTAFSMNATLAYDLFTSGGRPARIRAAERLAKAAELGVEITLQQLELDVTGDYYDLQAADEDVRINQAAVRNAQISLRDTQALERAGLGTRFDVLRSQVQLADAQQTLTNALANQQTSRRQLARRLSVPAGIDLAAADVVDVAGQWTLPLEESIVLALKNRAELEQLLVRREASNQQRKAALAALGPTITLSAQYSILDSFSDQFGMADGYNFNVGLQWRPFDGGQARARATQQEADMAISETRFADQRSQIQFEVERAYASLRSSFENIGTTTQALEQAKEALRLARLRFQAGVGTQTDVINAETDLTRSEGNRVRAILGYNRALAQLKRATTNLPIARGATLPPANTPAPETIAPVQ